MGTIRLMTGTGEEQWVALDRRQREAMRWVDGRGCNLGVHPGALAELLKGGYLEQAGGTLRFSALGQDAWDARPDWDRT